MERLVSLLFVVLFPLLTIVGVLGNLIVIYAIAGDKKMRRSVMNIFLLNLVSFSDDIFRNAVIKFLSVPFAGRRRLVEHGTGRVRLGTSGDATLALVDTL